jgi:hypothetical protein
LLPLIERDFNPRGKEALFRLATIAREASLVIQQRIEQLFAASVHPISPRELHLDCRVLAAVEPYLVRELLAASWQHQSWPLREMTQEKWNEVVAMTAVAASDKKTTLPGNIAAVRKGSDLVLSAE